MADAEFTFKAEGADSVVAANKRIEKSMNAQAKASSKSGYAVLEASRALEDFSMAGMRGALNNIPQLLMNLGVGAGLTGVIGALTVVVWKGTEYLNAYLDKLQELTEASANVGTPSFNEDSIREAFSDEAIKRAKEMTETLNQMAKSQDYLNELTNRYVNETQAGASLAFAQEMLTLTKNKADEDEKGLATLQNKIRLEKFDLEMSEEKATSAKAELEDVQKLRREQEAIINATKSVDIEDWNKKTRDKYREFSNELLSKPNYGWVQRGDMFEKDIVPRTNEQNIKEMEKAAKMAEEWRKKEMALRGLSKSDIEKSVQEALVAEEKIKLIDQEIEKKEHLLKIAKEQEESAKITSEKKIKELQVLEEIESIERKQKQDEKDQKKREEEAKKLAAKMLQERAPDVSQFLSDQGRVGLAANEAKSAMDVLSIAKEQLKTLKEIARNTSKNRVLAYA